MDEALVSAVRAIESAIAKMPVTQREAPAVALGNLADSLGITLSRDEAIAKGLAAQRAAAAQAAPKPVAAKPSAAFEPSKPAQPSLV